MYVYLYSLHVSGSHVPIIRRIIVSMRHLVYVSLCYFPHRPKLLRTEVSQLLHQQLHIYKIYTLKH